MHARATDLAYGVKIVDARVSPLVNQHSAAEVMRCRDNRYRLVRDVDADFQTFAIDEGEATANGVSWQARSNVEQHEGIAMRLHLDDEWRAPRHREERGPSIAASSRP